MRPSVRPLILLVATCCLTYVISQFLRNATGVIAPDLARDFRISPSGLGLLSGVFFLSFGCVQLPLGICLDRFGARHTMSLCLLLTALACCLFALAGGFGDMILARVIMGIGCCSLLMGPMLLYSRWFPRDRFATISGFHLAIGNLGAIFATAPLAFAAAAFGWRNVFWVLALFSLGMAWMTHAFIRDAPPGSTPRARESWAQAFRGLKDVLLHPDVRKILPLNVVGYASFVTLLGLWFSPYLADIHGFDLESRGKALLLVSLVHACGIMFLSPADRWLNSRKRPVLIGVGASVLAMTCIALLSRPSSGWVIALFTLQGASSVYTSILLAHGRSVFPDQLTGRAITLFNMGNILGVFLLQGLSGLLLQLFVPAPDSPTPEIAYRAIFAMLALLLALAGGIYACVSDRRPGENPPRPGA